MKFPARGVAWLLPLLLTGCLHFHKRPPQVQTLAPPIMDVPPAAPGPAPAHLPPPVITEPSPATAPVASVPTKPAKPPRVRHRRHEPVKTPEVAANIVPQVSAIGQLSTGDISNLLQQTTSLIAVTERSLNAITRKLNDQDTKTAAQIREFLKQARAALASGDADGAHTLAVKARVLLDQLVQ